MRRVQDLYACFAAWQAPLAHPEKPSRHFYMGWSKRSSPTIPDILQSVWAMRHVPDQAPPLPAQVKRAIKMAGRVRCLDCQHLIGAKEPDWKVRCPKCYKAYKLLPAGGAAPPCQETPTSGAAPPRQETQAGGAAPPRQERPAGGAAPPRQERPARGAAPPRKRTRKD